MKKPIIIFLLAAMVLGSVAIWLSGTQLFVSETDKIHLIVILLLVAFALFVGYRQLISVKRGEPSEDELSKKIMQKTAAISFYVSLYIWVFLIFLKDRIRFDTEELLGTGILAMSAVYGIVWLLLHLRGLRND